MSKIPDYTDRTRTLEEIAKLLQTSLEIKMLKGREDLWQVKLEKVKVLNTKTLAIKYAFIRNCNPNAALNLLCRKLSYAVVRSPDKGKIRLGEVVRGPLYLRLYSE